MHPQPVPAISRFNPKASGGRGRNGFAFLLGVALDPLWDDFRIALGSLWVHSEDHIGHFGVTLGAP